MQRVHRHPCEYFLGEVEWRWLEMWCAIHGITELLSIRGLLDKSRPKSSELLLNTIAMVDDDDNAQAEVWVQYDRLPFPDDSIECIVCAHLLEINDYADAAMSEAVRILKPGGMMIVFGYHRYSLLGLQKFFANDPDQYPPCSSRGGCRRILLDMGLDIVDDHMIAYRPFVDCKQKFDRLLGMEILGPLLVKPFGSLYGMIAQKDRLGYIADAKLARTC